MTEINKPVLMWGISRDSVSMTDRLFDDQLFVFKRDALAQIETYGQLWRDEGQQIRPLFPVLVSVTTTLCGADQAAKHDAEQTAWLEARRKKDFETAGEVA